jgi:hypothetical protein
MGSASELEYHLLLAHDLGLLRDKEYEQLQAQAVELKRMLSFADCELEKALGRLKAQSRWGDADELKH